jgi:hypothetical protein
LLHQASANLRDGVRTENQLTDWNNRPIAWVAYDGDERYVLVAKQYAHKGNASFMDALVEKAVESDVRLLFYSADADSYTVFDSEHYLENGIGSVGDSRREKDVKWLERPLDEGVQLGDYLDGAEPVTNDPTEHRPEKALSSWS